MDGFFVIWQSPNVDFETRKIVFQAEGKGAKGIDMYAFALNFHSDIDLEVRINITIPYYSLGRLKPKWAMKRNWIPNLLW